MISMGINTSDMKLKRVGRVFLLNIRVDLKKIRVPVALACIVFVLKCAFISLWILWGLHGYP